MTKGNWWILAFFYMMGYLPGWIGFCIVFFIILIWNRKIVRNPYLLTIAIAFFVFSSIYSPQIKIPHKDFGLFEGNVKIVSNPETNSDQIKFIGKTSFSKVSFTSKDTDSPIYHGATCQITGHLTVPDPATNPGQFDYRDYLSKQGVYYEGYNVDISKCEGRSWLSNLFQLRDAMKNKINDHLSDETEGWLIALLFGDRTQLSDDLIETFQFWGLSHLLAISGLHVGIILSICYFVLSRVLHFTKEQSSILLLIIIPIYIVIAGSQPPVMRAGIMAVFIILFSFLKRFKMDASDLISIVLILLLIVNPYLIYQLSFQFSFAVTFALILSKRLLKDQSWLMLSLRVSLISQLIILPLQFYYFYYTNVWSFLINLIYIPYFTLLVIPAVMVIFLSILLIPSLTPVLDQLFAVTHGRMIELLLLIDQPQYTQWIVGKPHIVLIIVYTILFIYFMKSWEKKAGLQTFVLAVFLMVNWFVPFVQRTFDQSLTITMLDVGQAESIIVELPYNQGVYVIDVGEEVSFSNELNHHNYERIIKPFLWSKGISNVNGLIVSHFDHDHAGSIQPFIKDFVPSTLYTHPFKKSNYQQHVTLKYNDLIKKGPLTIKILSPKAANKVDEENDRSLVFILSYDGFDMLFTGDITKKVEEGLDLNSIKNVDVLKVAHHGSETSTTKDFLTAIKAEVSFISVGKHNPFGHPHNSVLDSLKTSGVTVYRTDLNGALTLKYADGQSTIVMQHP